MSEIIELIKVLRERTGAGMMDCKHALVENNNDIEKSVVWLREKGVAKQAKKASRIAAEGLTTIKISGNKALILEINCETDFVARSIPFINLVEEVAKVALAKEPADVEALKAEKTKEGKLVSELFNDAGLKLGEKLDLRRFAIINKDPDDIFASYIHNKGQISAIVVAKTDSAEFGEQLAMSVVNSSPLYLSVKDIPAADIAKEKEIQTELVKEDESFAKKPAAIQAKILEGKVAKHFAEQSFLSQEFVVNPEITVEQACKDNKTVVKSFIRYQVGEGIEKRKEDFAAEVAAEMK